MRDLGRRVGIAEFGDPHTGQPATGFADPVHQEIRELHRLYRDKCLGRGLINVGYRSEEHTSELQSLMRTSYAVFCLKKKKHNTIQYHALLRIRERDITHSH